MRGLRLIPVVTFAALCLLAIKTIGFMGDGQPTASQWAVPGAMWNRLSGGFAEEEPIITGATPEAKPQQKAQPPMAALPKDKGAVEKADATKGKATSERALIERLQERRQELEARERDLEMRENLIKAAEKQLDGRIDELKGLEGKGGETAERMKSIVVMYESMGPKEAARVFDRLDSRTLVDLVKQMNPRKVSEIIAKMQPESAERLTVELARKRPGGDQALPPTDLKRIDAKVLR